MKTGRHIIPISGKDSLATAIVMREFEPSLSFEYVWHDTGWELPETHEWIGRVERKLGPIVRCGDDLTEIVAEQGLLPSPRRRFCTKYAKIKPMRDFLGSAEATIYLGLRADEPSRVEGIVSSRRQTHRFPLHEFGITLPGVWGIVTKADLLPPQFRWQWMVDRVAELGGTRPKEMPDWEWNALFAGRSRSNCDRCFYQRLYEWVWLHETHPNLFREAVKMEAAHQHLSTFRLIGKDMPLDSILSRAGAIKERRARSIARFLQKRRQGSLFEIINDNPFGAVSCGLFCGK